MKWFRLKEKVPKSGEVIFIKFIDKELPKYYIVNAYYRSAIDCWEFEEASGEHYATWYETDIEGWTSLSEIEKNEKWN